MSEIKNENSALRYMTEQGIASGTNAQNFLQNRLREPLHGRYTQEQINRLHASGGPAVVNASHGAIPAGPWYDSQNPTKNQPDKVTYEGGSQLMSAEEIREKYGLKYDEELAKGRDVSSFSASDLKDKAHGLYDEETGALYTETGKYVGSIGTKDDSDDGSMKHDYYDKYEGMRSLAKDKRHDIKGKEWSNWDSFYDVAGAVRILTNDKGTKKVEKVVEEENKPIEHSPELQQAHNRIRTYENDVFSGKTSDDIFGSSYGNFNKGYSDKFDSNKGGAGIGTAAGNMRDNSSIKAAESFLDAKKTDVKKSYNFTPA